MILAVQSTHPSKHLGHLLLVIRIDVPAIAAAIAMIHRCCDIIIVMCLNCSGTRSIDYLFWTCEEQQAKINRQVRHFIGFSQHWLSLFSAACTGLLLSIGGIHHTIRKIDRTSWDEDEEHSSQSNVLIIAQSLRMAHRSLGEKRTSSTPTRSCTSEIKLNIHLNFVLFFHHHRWPANFVQSILFTSSKNMSRHSTRLMHCRLASRTIVMNKTVNRIRCDDDQEIKNNAEFALSLSYFDRWCNLSYYIDRHLFFSADW